MNHKITMVTNASSCSGIKMSSPITVVQMLPELDSGGVERGTLEMGEFLADCGHRSIVVSGGGRLVSRLEGKGSVHYAMPVGKKTPQSIMCLPRLRRLLLKKRVDILHLRSRVPAWVGYLTVKTMPKQLRPKIVTTFHGYYSINKYSAIMAKGERVIAVSKTMSDHISTVYGIPDHRIRIIYRGFDPHLFNPDQVSRQRIDNLRRQWNLAEDGPPVILMPARITRLKGHDLLIRSLNRIQHLPWTVICAGDPSDNSTYTAELRTLIRSLSLGHKIKMVGYCDDMPTALMLSDVVVSTSTKPESFGRIAIEAQAMAKPVIASAHGGSLETVLNQRSGWLVPPGNEDALATALSQAISDPQLRQAFGQQGRRWVQQRFTVDRMCRDTLAVYSELLGV